MMHAWMMAAEPAEKDALACRAGISRQYLHHLGAADDAAYRRQPKADKAGEIERVTAEMHKESGGRLPEVLRTDLIAACRACPYAQRCLGSRVIVSEFPVLLTEDDK